MAGGVNSLQDYGFFTPEYINKVINDLVIDPQTYGLVDQYMPTVDQDPSLGTDMQWDEDTIIGGMTKTTDVDSPSPIISEPGGISHRWTPPHFREKAVIGSKAILNLRQLGTSNKPRQLGVEINKWIQRLRLRIDNRIYWLKWEAIQNSAAFNILGNGLAYSLNYSTVGFHPQPAVSWTGAMPTILDDIIGFISQFRTVACYPKTAYFGTTVLQAMLSDTTLRQLINAQIGFNVNEPNIFNTTPGQVGLSTFLQNVFGGITFNYYPIGPIYSLIVILPNTAGAAATTVVDGELEPFAVNDIVMVKWPDGTRATATLTAVGSNTVTGVAACPRGTVVRKRAEFLHNDRFVIFADMPSGQLGGDTMAEFRTVANPHGEGGIGNMQSGILGKSINKENEDPPRIEMVASVSGAPLVYHTDGPWCAAQVIF